MKLKTGFQAVVTGVAHHAPAPPGYNLTAVCLLQAAFLLNLAPTQP
jgi:hypothetical protein